MERGRYEGHACAASHADGFTIPGAEPSYAPDLSLEPVHREVHLDFDTPRSTALGRVVTTVRCNRHGARTLRLDAISLEDVSVGGKDGRALTWRYDGRAIDLTWEDPFEKDEERRFQVQYRVVNPVSGMVFSTPDARYPNRSLFALTDHETERARYWLPCVDYPTVRTTFDFHLTAPRDFTILANGTLVDEEELEDGTKRAHWRLDYPCPSYLCCIAAGRFVRHDDDEVDGIPISYFAAAPFQPQHLERSFARTPAMLRWLQDRLGNRFPFKKYFQIALPWVGGAMENISLVTWDQYFLTDEAFFSEYGHVVDSVNIHEMAHSYFGDAIVCRHFEHSWLKESWATYIETVWKEENLGADESDYDLVLNADAYFEEADNKYVRPIVTREYNSSWDLFDRHLYPGGAWRIHMLRSMMGDDTFWAAVKDYVGTYSGDVVETADFRRVLEKHSGLNLTRFFEEWIHKPGYPKLKISFRHDADKGRGTFKIEQTQQDEKTGVGLFHLDLDVEFEDAAGEIHRRRVSLKDAREILVVPMSDKPRQVRANPDSTVLCALDFNPGEDLLARSLQKAPDVAGRIWAARELIKTGTRKNLQMVGAAMQREAFWGVRAAVAKSLGSSGASAAIPVLAEMLVSEKDPRAKPPIARACGAIRDTRLRHALLAFLDRNQPPLSTSAALEALGKQRNAEDLARFKAAGAEDPGIHGIIRNGALLGAAGLRTRAALQFIKSRAVYGAEPEVVRPAAVDAFGRCARLQDRVVQEAAAETLIDLTRDTMEKVRTRAAAALAGLGVPAAIPALMALKARQSNQEGPGLERMISRIRKGAAGNEVASLTKQLEKLEEKHRKVEDRLQDLEARLDGGAQP